MKSLTLMSLILAVPALAQEAADLPTYQDDRSNATALIQSFYNAINRGEYTRAFSYYGQTEASFDDFAAGYDDTSFVTLTTGEETSEGAAGSLYYTVPVAIDAESKSGAHTQFAGCYTLRLEEPANQAEPPYQPLHIETGNLQEASGELESLLPATCTE